MSFEAVKITSLKGSTNYPLWSQHVERLLRAEGIWAFVDGRKQRPVDTEDETSKLKGSLDCHQESVQKRRIRLSIHSIPQHDETEGRRL